MNTTTNGTYEAPAGIWHVVVNGHELRQHCFTRESALVRAAIFGSRAYMAGDVR